MRFAIVLVSYLYCDIIYYTKKYGNSKARIMSNKDAVIIPKSEEQKDLKFSIITQDELEYAKSLLGSCKEMSVEEIRKMTEKRMQGNRISDTIRQEWNEGW